MKNLYQKFGVVMMWVPPAAMTLSFASQVDWVAWTFGAIVFAAGTFCVLWNPKLKGKKPGLAE